MTQIRIDEITESKSGKSWRIKAGEKWYGASKDLFSVGDKGKVFEVKISASDFGPWIDNASTEKEAPKASTGVPRGIPDVAPWWMPYASNVCAHAIQAGYIKEPEHLKAWVLAAKEAAEGASKNDINF